MRRIVFARIGAIFYVFWGLLHFSAAFNVFHLGLSVPPTAIRGRLFQDAAYLVSFATVAIVLAITLNWRNSHLGCWLNGLIVGVADVPFIVFVLAPGYMALWPGALGPILWIAAMIFTVLGQLIVTPPPLESAHALRR